MQVDTTASAEIAIRTLNSEDVRDVHAWLDHLRNWGNDLQTMKNSQKVGNGNIHVLKGSKDLRIFFSLDEANKRITVVDIAKHSVLGTGV